MGKLRNGYIYIPGQGVAGSSVGYALNEILKQPMGSALGMKIKSIKRTIEQQWNDVAEEHKRLVEQYSNEDGELADEVALREEFENLVLLEFECELLTIADIEGMSLPGFIWTDCQILKENHNVTEGEGSTKAGETE